MPTPGFKYLTRVEKSDGTQERMEINSFGDVLKKYTMPDQTRFSDVQNAQESHQDFLNRINNTDALKGFRKLF